MNYLPITEAEIVWPAGLPRSHTYGDHYFNTDGGLDETRYVFIRQNGLPDKWRDKASFVVAETGFGTGLNFLATSHCWLNTTSINQKLTYISVEKHPLNKADMQRALALWPELEELSREFIARYPANLPGFHCVSLFNARIKLLLLIGDACEMLSQLHAQVDVWYLDGFSPKANTAMWSLALFNQVARLSKMGCSFTTYTAAGNVRRGLQSAGFEVSKVLGFGKKREMLYGEMPANRQQTLSKPWFDLSNIATPQKKEIVIIGAGIAGLTSAYVFANSGWDVTVFEKESTVANGASGNPVGLVMPRFTADMNRGAQFYTQSFMRTVEWLNDLKNVSNFASWWRSGVLHLMPEEKRRKLSELKIPSSMMTELSIDEIKKLYGLEVKHGGYFVHQAGYLEPVKLCQFLFGSLLDKVKFHFSSEITELKNKGGKWQIMSASTMLAHSCNVMIANASDAAQLVSEVFLPLIPVRGQVSQVSVESLNQRLSFPIVCENYLTPIVNGYATLGASYERENLALDLRVAEHQVILSELQDSVPGLLNHQGFSKGRASLRCTTHDRFPVLGPVPDVCFYQTAYADIRHGKPQKNYLPAEYQPGLFLNTGHGSRGLVSAYPAAELLLTMLEKQALIYSNEVLESLHPARFLVKQMKRQ